MRPSAAVLVLLADLAAGDLARQVALDRFAAALQRLLVDIGHDDVEAGERADMGDAARPSARRR